MPGKLLEAFHLDPSSTLRLGETTVLKEVGPLTTLGIKNGWADEENTSKALKSAREGKYQELHNLTLNWHEKLNPKEEKHSSALAGWMLIQNLRAMERKKKIYNKPYQGLRTKNIFDLKKRVEEAIEIESYSTSKEKKDVLQRHFLSLIVCLRIIRSNFQWGPNGQNNKEESYGELKRFLLGQELYRGNPQDHDWTLSLVYGFERDKKWLAPSLEKIKSATEEIWPKLNNIDKIYIKSLQKLGGQSK